MKTTTITKTGLPLLVLSFYFLAFSACSPRERTFDPMVGYAGDTVCMDMDMENAVLEGVVLPAQGEYFHFVFDTTADQPLYYKIYYQNESYRFDDADSLNYENFYGSWEDVTVGFRRVPADGHVADSFRIVGNPRDERQYYGADLTDFDCSLETLHDIEREIRNDTHWFRYVRDVAAPENNRSLEEQLFLDTRWVLNERRHQGGDVNHRWKRNPRTGLYSFLLVVCDEEGLQRIPDYVQHINRTDADSHYVNPYSWFAQNKNRHIHLLHGSKMLRTRAVLTPQQGVYVDETQIRVAYRHKNEIPGRVGSDTTLYRHALYQQFFPAISQERTLRNIPLVMDIDDYTQADYDAAATRYDSTQLVYDHPHITDCPGSTVYPSADGSYISIINPGNANFEIRNSNSEKKDPSKIKIQNSKLKKESTGVKTRVGFAYGKYRGKIKFPPMLNKENVWNGLTYAFWLIYQDGSQWNRRRPSYHGGYISKNDDSENPDRHVHDNYSEIDIEIVKASRYWPKDYYTQPDKVEDGRANSDVMYCCTNWDLACQEPSRFAAGLTHIPYQGQSYEAMRWTDTYKALTTKTPIPNSIFDEDYYYFEIEWKPKEIIWRVGPDPQHMRVVGYMNDTYTAIPSNQMLCIVTQEYHYSEWWPPIVYMQGLIPFNATDIEGRVYEIVIE